MALFDPLLAKKPQIVALNKIDLPEVQVRWLEIEAQLKEHGYPPFAVSALAGTNIRTILYKAAQLLDEIPPTVPTADMPVYRLESDPRDFKVKQTQEGWQVNGEAIERAAAMTYWEHDQSVRRFQRILQTLGIEDALLKVGVRPGDTVFIGEYELEWQD